MVALGISVVSALLQPNTRTTNVTDQATAKPESHREDHCIPSKRGVSL